MVDRIYIGRRKTSVARVILRSGNGKIGNRSAVGGIPDFRILTQIAHQDDFVDTTGHRLPSFPFMGFAWQPVNVA